jgi:hypothetical protein
MAEPPAGHNHGWERNDFGGWSALETGDEAGRVHRPFTPKNYHGRSYGYRKMKCRCVLCRAWKSLDNKQRYDKTLVKEEDANT